MFGKLFGAKEQPKQPQVDVAGTKAKLDEQIENIEMRIKKIEKNMVDFKQQALERMKKGEKKQAALLLRKSKMQEKELIKLEGQNIILEQQK